MRMLVTGAGGQVGREVVDVARAGGIEVVGLTRSDLDITDPAAVSSALAEADVSVVVNCAAWTAVDDAEGRRDEAFQVNEHGARVVAQACAVAGAHLVHVSTEMVFDGRDAGGYAEDAVPAPISVYGASKLAGERAVLAVLPASSVVRTSWVFGAHGGNFVKTIARIARGRDAIDVVADQVGRPTWARHLAAALIGIGRARPAGILHVADAPVVTKADFAREIIEAAGLQTIVRDVTSDHFPLPAARPACAVLRVARTGTPEAGDWHAGLAPTLAAAEAV